MKIKIIMLTICALAATTSSQAQQAWSLSDCIDYAQRNNIGVQQQSLNVEDSDVKLSTARMSRLPDLNASMGANANFGLSPTRDGTQVNNNQISGSLGVSTSIPVFAGMRINKQIKGAKLSLAASIQDMERAKENLSVNVMTLYLQVLFNKELVAVAEHQLSLSTQQMERSRALVAEGRKPLSTQYESEALQANDELNLTQSRNELTLALLNLSQALNRPSADGFDVATPTIDSVTLEVMHELGSPDKIYEYADAHRPAIMAERIRLEGSENDVKLAKAALYPTLNFSAGYGTNLFHSFATGSMNTEFWSQVRNNGNEYIGLSLNIPIFNRRATRNNIKSSKLSLRNQELTLTQTQQEMRKQIEQAYYKADAAYVKYRAADKALASANVAFRFEQERAEAGRSTIFDFNDARTRMERAKSEMIRAKYEFVFSAKILDFYQGRELTL